MLKYAKIIDEETKEVQIGVGCSEEYYKSIGMSEMDVEQAYNFRWYVAEYVPEKPQPTEDEMKLSVRGIRNNYLSDTDIKMIIDYPISDEERESYKQYREYLRNYTSTENWWEYQPKSYEKWKEESTLTEEVL